MEGSSYQTTFLHSREDAHEGSWRHKCGCIRTSDKLKQILKSFPTTPPPSPSNYEFPNATINNTCISAYCTGVHQPHLPDHADLPKEDVPKPTPMVDVPKPISRSNQGFYWIMKCTRLVTDLYVGYPRAIDKYTLFYTYLNNHNLLGNAKTWYLLGDLVQLLQLSVTATALALYYLIYCYMQLIYYTLRSVLYFHNADGPMKITIGVVTLTSLVVGINLILRMERIIGIFP